MKKYNTNLRVFKSGFQGSEFDQLNLLALIKNYLKTDKKLSFIDIGTGSGERLNKTLNVIDKICDLKKSYCLDPIPNNTELEYFVKRNNLKYLELTLEKAKLPDNYFDLAFITQSAYYFNSQTLAHNVLLKALKKDGLVIITLISKDCVLNKITKSLLKNTNQKVITAESYLRLPVIKKFKIEKDISFVDKKTKPLKINLDFFISNKDNLKSLAYILIRDKKVKIQLKELRSMLIKMKSEKNVSRKNYLIILRKK